MANKYRMALLLVSLAGIAILIAISLRGQKRHYPRLGTDMITQIKVMEDHKGALNHWLETGITDAVLVNIDAHDDMRSIPVDQPGVVTPRNQGNEAGREISTPQLSNSNFIRAAARQGIVKKVVWIVPRSYELFTDTGARMKAMMSLFGFAQRDIATFRKKNGCFTGTVDGLQLVVCDINTLPDLREPVLLSVDVDYFPAMNITDNQEISLALKETFKAIYHKNYRVRDTTVAYSVNGGFLDCSYRWVGDLVIDSLRIPALNGQEKLPFRYAYLQGVDLLLQMGRYDELMGELELFLKKDKREPAVLLYAAKASQGLGDMEKAFSYAEQACVRDSRYCYALPELGTALLESRGVALAEKFFCRGYELCPEMDHGQFRLALAMKNSGRHEDAIRFFKTFRKGYGAFPVDFYIAESFSLQGDNASALKFYDSGRDELVRNPSLLAGFGDLSVIERGAQFYESQGLPHNASLLREKMKSPQI
jgi:tetratricopeptide (TPR) repeat protein